MNQLDDIRSKIITSRSTERNPERKTERKSW